MTCVSADQLALLRGVIASPDDDLPRLVYADWLEEHGDEVQANFIRDSIAGEDVAAVAEAHGRTWLADIGLDPAGEPRFVRGMPEYWRFPLHFHFFVDIEAGLFDRVPVRAVKIEAEKDFGIDYGDVKRLAEMPQLARLHTLELEGSSREWARADYDPRAFPSLFESPHLSGLRRLGLVNCVIDEELVWLSKSPAMSGLRALAVASIGVAAVYLSALARSPHLAGLTEFWLADYRFEGTPAEQQAAFAELNERFGTGFHPDEHPLWV